MFSDQMQNNDIQDLLYFRNSDNKLFGRKWKTIHITSHLPAGDHKIHDNAVCFLGVPIFQSQNLPVNCFYSVLKTGYTAIISFDYGMLCQDICKGACCLLATLIWLLNLSITSRIMDFGSDVLILGDIVYM